MAPECLRRTQLSEVGWQSIYCTLEELQHYYNTECSVSELPIGPWHDEIATACHLEDGSSGYIRSGNTLVLINAVAVLGPVSSGMGDCLWAGKLSHYITSHQGLLSLPSLRGR